MGFGVVSVIVSVCAAFCFVCVCVYIFSYLCFAIDYTKFQLKLEQQSNISINKVLLDFVTQKLLYQPALPISSMFAYVYKL